MGDAFTNRVLVVDRDNHSREVTTTCLADLGWNVLQARRASEARVLLQRNRPSVVVTEILLPGEDGLSLCRAIKNDPIGSIPPRILVLSILAAADRAREAGADAFLIKPVDAQHLAAVLQVMNGQHV